MIAALFSAAPLLAPAQPDNRAAATRINRTGATEALSRRVAIEGLTEPLANLKVSDLAGRDLSAELQPQTSDGRISVALNRAEPFVVKPKSVATLPLPDRGKIALPGGMVVATEVRPDGTPAKVGWYRLTFEASPLPAPWDSEGEAYVTRLTFGLRRPPEISEMAKLKQPVTIKLAFDGLTADEVPLVELTEAGLENEKSIDLRFQPRTPKPKLLVRSTISDVDLELRALARLDVRPQQREMLGFGLEEINVIVESVLAHGEPRPVERETTLAVQVDGRARAEPARLTLAKGEAGTSFALRSAGLGPIQVAATASGLTGAAIVEQRFPLGPLLAALLGGALGGYARRFVKGARRQQTGRRALEGVIVGLIGFVAGVLGVGAFNLPAALVGTEAGAFLIGALSGFAGVTILEMLATKDRAPAGANQRE